MSKEATKKNYDQKPLDQPADEMAGIKSKASFVEHLVHANGLEGAVHSERAYYLVHEPADYGSDKKTDDEYN